MTPESRLLIALTRAAITGAKEPLCLEVDWEKLLKLARMHKLGALAYDGLKKSGADLKDVPESAVSALRKSCLLAISQSVQMDALRAKLENGLRQRQVRHIFLKGAVLKYDYPVPALRTMSDMDILVFTGDYPAIDEVALELGGKPEVGDGNHKSFVFPGNLEIEFHPNLLHHDSPVGTQINPGWQYAKPGDDYSAELTEEGFYLNTVCHLADHFVAGGVGVRFVLDVWINRHRRKAPMDRGFVERELKKFGLLEFVRNIEALSEHWFGDGESSELLEELGEYILTSGSHGTNERALLNAVSMSSGGSSRSALLSRVFYSREEMEDRYPWVKGRPWLLPVAWLVRAFRVLTTRFDLLRSWIRGTGAVSDDEAAQQKAMLNRFGIRRQKK